MARPADRFVKSLTDKKRRELEEFWKNGVSHRLRCRAHAILLTSQIKLPGWCGSAAWMNVKTICQISINWSSFIDCSCHSGVCWRSRDCSSTLLKT